MKKDLIKKEETALALPTDFAEDQGIGFEEADSDSYAIPFIQVLQRMSPQLDPDNGAYIETAKTGDLIQSVSKEVYKGKDGLLVVPVHFTRLFVEWVTREQGGGFRGVHLPSDPLVMNGIRDESGKLHIENGNILQDTRYHYCLLLLPTGPSPVVLTFTSTQTKKSRAWLTIARSLKLVGKDQRPYTPPLFSHVYRVVSVQEANSKGTWSGMKITLERRLDLEKIEDQTIYLAAKEFRNQILAGKAKAALGEELENDETEF